MMRVVRDPCELASALRSTRSGGKTLALIPTMGALHEGHLSLVRLAKANADSVAVSIFVNPTQFGPQEDFRVYPRAPKRDAELLEREGVGLVFTPSVSAMYPPGSAVTVDPGPVGDLFEGAVRPGHFRGVLTVVAKLLHLVQPDIAVFGQKDAQQLFLVRRMTADLNLPVRILEADTVREPDGLAMSSRNVYLKAAERPKATVLHRALCEGERVLREGIRSLADVKEAMHEVLSSVPEFAPDYATAVSEERFAEDDPLPDSVRLITAGRLGSVRLIDNARFDAQHGSGTHVSP